MLIHRAAIILVLLSFLGGCAQLSGGSESGASAEEVAKLEARIADLSEQLRAAEQANQQLQEENAELSKRIEMLKVLDQAVEEKRKTLISQ